MPVLHKAVTVVGKLKDTSQIMTYQEFEQKLKTNNGFDKYWYYGLCVTVIILSLLLLFLITSQPGKFKGNHTFHYSGFFILLLLGTYGLYKLPNRYKIITIKTSQSLTKKKVTLETLLSQMNIPKVLSDNYCSCTYRKSFWSSSYDIYLFYDGTSICFSVQGQDYFDGGFIDFGGTEKLRRKIYSDIQTLLM